MAAVSPRRARPPSSDPQGQTTGATTPRPQVRPASSRCTGRRGTGSHMARDEAPARRTHCSSHSSLLLCLPERSRARSPDYLALGWPILIAGYGHLLDLAELNLGLILERLAVLGFRQALLVGHRPEPPVLVLHDEPVAGTARA